MSNINNLSLLCVNIKHIIESNDSNKYQLAANMISRSMAEYPDSAKPHNLMGILKELTGDHAGAMKHFRAAYALDPQDQAVKHNFEILCSFNTLGKTFEYGDENDCQNIHKNVTALRTFKKLTL